MHTGEFFTIMQVSQLSVQWIQVSFITMLPNPHIKHAVSFKHFTQNYTHITQVLFTRKYPPLHIEHTSFPSCWQFRQFYVVQFKHNPLF